MSPFVALIPAVVVALAAFRLRALNGAGAAAAIGVAVTLLGAQGWGGGAVLLAFFIPTTLVSQWLPDATARLDAKGNRRDAVQVLANGGAAALGAALWPDRLEGMLVATAALAAAAADTWATSWGSGSRTPPRSIAGGRVVSSGTSGGITWRGSLGGTAGATVVALTGGLVSRSWQLGLIATVAGITGMLIDSLIGAVWQGRFLCPECQRPTERAIHGCGTRSELTGGVRWLTNDAVNALASTIAGFAALLAWPSG
ncbi:MAG: DUF92 domain-containing protein [Gemmatimonadota bacterium]